MKLVRKHWIILLLTPLVLLLDQTSKLLVHRFFYPYQARQIIPGFLEFRLVFNRGLAFGLFSDLEDFSGRKESIKSKIIPTVIATSATLKVGHTNRR